MEGFNGLGGDDTFVGGSGQDMLIYEDDIAGVVVNMGSTETIVGGDSVEGGTARDGFGGTDTFTDIEQVIGSRFGDVIIGSDQDNVLIGEDGDDTLRGGIGNDNLIGGDGNDIADYRSASTGVSANLATGLAQDGDGGTDFLVEVEGLRGSSHDDTLVGDDGDNTLHGAGGNDFLDGGAGNDWASYNSASGGVTVDLSTGTASDGLGGTDTLVGIENVRGGDFADSITGDDGNNQLKGGLGNDTLDGGAGTDIAVYNDAPNALTIDLTAGTATDSITGEVDTLISIEGVVGTQFADSIIGNSTGATTREFLNGGGGNDTIVGGGVNVQSILNLSSYKNSSLFIDLTSLEPGSSDGYQGTLTIGSDTITFDNIDGFIGTNFHDSVTGSDALNDYFRGTAGQDTFDGGIGGFDTLSYRNSPEAVAVNLTGGNIGIPVYADSTGDTIGQNLTLGAGQAIDGFLNDQDNNNNTFNFDQVSNIEAVEGGDGNDSIWGTAGDNRFDGGAGNDFFSGNGGNDMLIGGVGIDRASYSGFGQSGPVAISTGEGGFVTKFASPALDSISGTDTLSSIESFAGTPFNDTMQGSDLVYTGTQRNGGTFELFSGGLGDDFIDGGEGFGTGDGQFDIVDYGFQSSSAVRVDLGADTLSGMGTATGGGGNDTLFNIDMVIGSNFNDTLLGGSASRSYQGQLFEQFRGGAGADTIDGRDGQDRADFQTANAPVYANLGSTALVLTGTPYGNVTIAGGTAIDGTDANSGTPGVQFSRDTLINVEDLRGSNFSDYLAGGGTQNAGTPYDFEVFEGLEGNDTLDGRAGFDLASYSRSDHAVNVDLAAGKAFDGYGTVDKLVSIEGVIGSDFDDTLKGSSADGELFRGGAGNDTIDGGGGLGDAVNYNTSPDAVFVHLGNGVADDGFGTVDTLIGISAVRGSIHDDWLIGSDGNDSLEGLQGNDRLDGGEGFDYAVYTRSDSGVSVDLSSGIALDGAGGNDSLTGIEGVVGSAFNDTMIGDAGDNVFESGGGVDSIDGGDGIDVVTFRNAKAGVVANMATLGGSTLVGGSTIVNVEGVEGSAFNDRLTGDAGPNRLLGGAGLDSLTGGDGDDTLDGGAGVDVLTGGAGNDLYVIDTASDGVIEAIGGGDDTVNASVSYTLGTNVENIVLIGAANINATGNAVANRLFGNSGDNVLDGKAGADTMQGGAGNDTYVVDDVGDQTAESGEGGGIDMVRAGVNWTLDSNIENLTLTGTAALQGTGNALSNLIIGNAAANVIDGRGGDDTMQGGGGNDVYFVDSSADVVTESAGGGIDTVFSVADYTLGAEVENLTFDGSVVTIGNRSGTGNLLANVLTGAQGNDSLVGLAGNDTLDGGTGDDTLVGGLGDDTFIVDSALDVVQENALEGTDTVVASFTYTLGANLDNLVLGGAGNLAGTGNELNNHITGNAGNNTLDGGAGADTLEGGAGNDTYIVNTPNDKIIESSLASGGVDTVLLSADFSAAAAGDVTYVLGNGIENGTVLGSSTVNVTGNASANNLVGNIQNNVLNGGGGKDTLDGLFGADTLVGGTGNDTYTVRYNDPLSPPNPFAVTQIVEIAAASGGIDTAIVSVNNYRLAAGVENMTLVDDPSILVARGNSGNNFIIGNSEHNQLFGDLGNDTLDGGVDADTVTGGNKLYGGAGSDSYIFRNPNDQIIEVGGSAADKALAAVSISLAASAGVENAQALTVQQIADLSHLTVEELLQIDPSVGDIDITGNSLGNNIVGNEGDNILNGGAGVDTLDGGGGNDTYVFALGLDKVNDSGGDNGIDEIQAFFTVSLAAYPTIENLTLLGTDNLAGTGNTKANQITGNSGNNTLDGGAGSDTLIGGDGNDVYVVDNAGDRVRELGTGTDEVRSTVTISIAAAGIVEADSLGNIENVTLLGTAAISATGNDLANVLVGNAGANTLTGGLGDDTLDGGLGADRLVGGAGNDVYVINMLTDVIDESGGGTADEIRSATVLLDLNTRSGIENAMLLGKVGLAIVGDGNANRLEGNDGGNKISGNGGADTLIGNAGNDTLDGGAGDDSMAGGVGNDSYVVDSLSDTVVEASGEGTADTVTTSLSGYTLADEVENLVLVGAGLAGTGNALANRITGTAGADTLDGGAGNDTLTGGAGNDTYLVDAQGDSIIDTAGVDTVIASASYSIAAIASIENLTAATGSAAINLTGNAAANTLTGNDGNNILDGGAGKDTMHGGAGADIYIVDNVGDVIFDDAGTDIDTVQSKISLNLTLAVGEGGGIVENLVLIGAGNLNATGNGGDNALTGNAGNNILDGGQGADTMTGGAGADTYVVDNVGDVIVESILPAGGVDTVITSLSDYTLLDGFENLTFLGSEAGNGTGNAANNKLVGGATGIQNNLIGLAGNDTLIGGEFADTLDGGTGIDSMVGGAGNDVYFVDALTDKVVDSAGTDEIRASITYSIAALAAIENLTLTVGDINGTGNAGNNVITGSGGANVLSGGAGNDTLLGGGDDDTLLGGAGNDSIDGQGGSDTVSYAGVAAAVTVDLAAGSATGDGTDTLTGVENVIGGNGADSITGDDGDNVLDGGAGADTMRGGAGADTYVVDNIHDVIFDDAGTDIDTVQSKISLDLTLAVGEGGGIVENLVLIGAGNLNATGNGGDNVLTGNAGNNILDGGAGSDTASYAGVSAALFLDLASGKVSGAGLDTLLNIEVVVGGSGSDWVIANSTMPGAYGLDGTGSIYTLSGFDNIRGTLGNDTLTGDNGDNILEGGAGDDSLDGGTGNDTAYYGNETAALTINLTTGEGSGAGDDTLTGMENVVGGTGNDVITGSTADNVLDGGRGVDVLTGGLGDDTFVFDNVGDQAIELADEGTDKVISSVSIAFLADNIENAQLTGAAALNLVANALDNDLVGNAGANHIDAGDGNDTLDGGAGADILTGGKGDDLYFVDNVGDKVVEAFGEGNDSVVSSVTYTLAANVENLTLTGSANINATGNADGNILIGNAGNNILDGKLGADTMSGGAGNDTYIVDNIGAQLTENLNEGTDLVKSSVNWTLGANFENLTLLGAAGIGIGNALDNLITGNAVANDLDGGAGNDTMVGLGGNDTYHVDSTGDVLIDSAGIDTVVVQNLDWTLATGFENLALQSLTGHVLTGNAVANAITGDGGADTLVGLAGNDTLDGGSGADSMDGGAGNDTYHVDQVGDVIIESPLASGGIDTVVVHFLGDFTLANGLENLTFVDSEGLGITGTGNAAANRITGYVGLSNDLQGLGGNDTLIGGNLADTLDGGAGVDSMVGGAGDDTYVIDVPTDILVEAAGQGTDTVQSAATYILKVNFENLLLTGTANINGTGNTDSNLITGNTGNNLLFGLGGNDVLNGAGGNDVLDGGTGADSLIGGLGDDRFIFDDAGDTATEAADEGTDTIVSSVSIAALAANVENAQLTGTGALDLTGNALDNNLVGNAGANHIDGGDGNDTLAGGAGSDTLIGGIGDDTFIFDAADTATGAVQGGDGNDTLLVTGALPGGKLDLTAVPNDRYQGIEHIDITGPSGVNNTLKLDVADVQALSDTTNDLVIDGGFFDTVDSQGKGWELQGLTQLPGGDDFYVVYTHTNDVLDIDATLYVNQDMTQLIS
jgi:Ca2+-binding RTX toxin-like protein